MGHAHPHSHRDHHHSHRAVKSIGWALLINLVFSLIELAGGIFTGSLAILADAIHDFGDSMSLAIAWYFEKTAQRERDRHFSYGYRRFSLFASILSALIIISGSIYVLVQTALTYSTPTIPRPYGMMIFAVVGLVANGVAAYQLAKGHTQNERVLTWHLVEDVMGWAAVLVGASVMAVTEWWWIDPLLATAIALFVLWNVSRHLKYSFFLFLQGTPKEFNRLEFQQGVSELKGVHDIHDCHVWSLDGLHNILSCHVVVKPELTKEEILALKEQIRTLASSFGHFHTTIETEELGQPCNDRCEEELVIP